MKASMPVIERTAAKPLSCITCKDGSQQRMGFPQSQGKQFQRVLLGLWGFFLLVGVVTLPVTKGTAAKEKGGNTWCKLQHEPLEKLGHSSATSVQPGLTHT